MLRPSLYPALDLFAIAVDAVSLLVLLLLLTVASQAVRGFRQSRQALTESASLIGAIVNALSSRMEASESAVEALRSELDSVKGRGDEIEDQQRNLRSSYLQVLRHLEELLSNDRRLVSELEQFKEKLSSFKDRRQAAQEDLPAGHERIQITGDILARLTDTERQTIDVLAREGAKAAPELGRRLKKSREHTSRLMKKLYLEGYIDRESSHAPYRYRLNEKVLAILKPRGDEAVTAKPSGKA